MLRWPNKETVDAAVRKLADEVSRHRGDILRFGYFGSYARSDWGVGSDIDIVVVVRSDERSFERRSLDFDLSVLPVPADILVYTQAEWHSLLTTGGRFADIMRSETAWVFERA